MTTTTLDELDGKILQSLSKNCRMSYNGLGNEIGLTSKSVKARVKKMQASGVIPSSLEMAFFELMRDAKHEKFKEIQALIK